MAQSRPILTKKLLKHNIIFPKLYQDKEFFSFRGLNAFDPTRVLHILRAGPGGPDDPDGATWEPITDNGIKQD